MSLTLLPLHQSLTLKLDNAVFMATLDGNRCKTLKNLLHEMALVFQFPNYYGHNLDALYDCMTDLEWLGVDKIFLLMTYPLLICSEEDHSKELETFLKVFKDILSDYKNSPIAFHVAAEPSFLTGITPS